MGKKGSQPAKSQEEVEPDAQPVLSGVFASDFPVLCQQGGIPPIAVRSLSLAGPSAQPAEDSGVLKHAVLVEEEEGGGGGLRAVHIRGWLLNSAILSIVSTALTGSHLKALHLWNVGLTAQTLQQVIELVQTLDIRQLVLDGNHLTAEFEPLVGLLSSRNSVEYLSLKCCGIEDSFLSHLCLPLAENRTLLSLDLSCNSVGDRGAEHLATALRLNRTLLSLSLANNRVGNEGANAVAQVLKRFPLNHSEIVMRRKLLSQRRAADGQVLDVHVPDHSPKRSPSAISLDKSGKISKADKVAKGKKDSKKEEKPKKEEKGKKGGVDSARKSRGKESKTGRQAADQPMDSPVASTVETENPLLGPLEEEDGKPCMGGNTSLVHLNLAYNHVSVLGVRVLLESVQAQSSGTAGLLRLALHGSSLPAQCTELAILEQLLQTRNPLLATGASSTHDIQP